IYNQNINDVRVTSFGFLYKNQNIDYTRMYLESKSLPYDHKIVISSRDLISFSSDIIILKDLVNDLNEGKTKISKIMIYATDNRGFTSSNRAKNIEKKIKEIVIKDIKNAKIKKQELARLEKAELKDKKIRQKQIKKSERKEKIS